MTAVPDLSEGLCLSGRAGLSPSAWDADADPEEHQSALIACERCPCLAPCREYIISVPSAHLSDGITGGLTAGQVAAERKRRR